MFLLFLLSAIFAVNQAGEHLQLVDDKEAYIALHKDYKVEWDERLADKALELAKDPVDVKGNKGDADKFVKGKEAFSKNDNSPMEEKVRRTLGKKIQDRDNEFKRFKTGARFGCNGVFNTTLQAYDFLSSVCLYKRY